MQLKYYLKENKLKVSDIARTTFLPYSTVNEIINGKTDIDRVQIGTGLKIADACNLSFEEFYCMCKQSNNPPRIQNGEIVIKNKAYYLVYHLNDSDGELYLCKVNNTNTRYVKEMAEWSIESIRKEINDQKSKKEVEAWRIDTI